MEPPDITHVLKELNILKELVNSRTASRLKQQFRKRNKKLPQQTQETQETQESSMELSSTTTTTTTTNAVQKKQVSAPSPTITCENYAELLTASPIKYTIPELKDVCEKHHIKKMGTKQVLVDRIIDHFKQWNAAVRIQRTVHNHIIGKYRACGGPALFNRKLCCNDEDFVSMEAVKDIPMSQFISYRDDEKFVYGFDITSLYRLIVSEFPHVKNPYNRAPIPTALVLNLIRKIRTAMILNMPINLAINQGEELTEAQREEMHVVDLFQFINQLGNYADASWFNELSTHGHIRFLRELHEIWSYRAELSSETKMEICPPIGNPFMGTGANQYINQPHSASLQQIRATNIVIIERLTRNGLTDDCRRLGAYYVLAALTLVSYNARVALPWLYESVAANVG